MGEGSNEKYPSRSAELEDDGEEGVSFDSLCALPMEGHSVIIYTRLDCCKRIGVVCNVGIVFFRVINNYYKRVRSIGQWV